MGAHEQALAAITRVAAAEMDAAAVLLRRLDPAEADLLTKRFNPFQPRGQNGRWVLGQGGQSGRRPPSAHLDEDEDQDEPREPTLASQAMRNTLMAVGPALVGSAASVVGGRLAQSGVNAVAARIAARGISAAAGA